MNDPIIVIARERPDTPDARLLIDELEAGLSAVYPDESRHGYSVDKLPRQGVDFFVLRADGEPGGCGGSQFHGSEYGELKRMYVRQAHRGRGFGRRVLDHLIDHARRRGIGVVRLETGVHQAAAIGLYEAAGFRTIAPFGPYTDDPWSRCYELRLPARGDEPR